MEKMITKNIRNIALLGHGGGGKTSLAESMLYLSKCTDRLGKTPEVCLQHQRKRNEEWRM